MRRSTRSTLVPSSAVSVLDAELPTALLDEAEVAVWPAAAPLAWEDDEDEDDEDFLDDEEDVDLGDEDDEDFFDDDDEAEDDEEALDDE